LELGKSCISRPDERLVLTAIENRLKKVRASKLVDVSSCAVVLHAGDELVYVQNGNIHIMLIDAEGGVSVVVAENPPAYEYPHLSEMQNIGT
jgi:hypothetical protein